MGDPWCEAVLGIRVAVRERVDAMRCNGTDEDYVRGKAIGRDEASEEILRILDDAIAEALAKVL